MSLANPVSLHWATVSPSGCSSCAHTWLVLNRWEPLTQGGRPERCCGSRRLVLLKTHGNCPDHEISMEGPWVPAMTTSTFGCRRHRRTWSTAEGLLPILNTKLKTPNVNCLVNSFLGRLLFLTLPNYSPDRNSHCTGGSRGAFADCPAHLRSVLRIDDLESEEEKAEFWPDYFRYSEVWKGIKWELREAGMLSGQELFSWVEKQKTEATTRQEEATAFFPMV